MVEIKAEGICRTSPLETRGLISTVHTGEAEDTDGGEHGEEHWGSVKSEVGRM